MFFMRTLSLCSPGWHGLFVLNSQRSSCLHLLSAQPILYICEYSTYSFSLSSSHFSLSKVKHIYYFYLLCVHISQSTEDSLWELFSPTMCIPRVSLSNLYPMSHLTSLSTFLVCRLVIWIFSEVEKIMYFLWTLNYVLSRHRILKEGVCP